MLTGNIFCTGGAGFLGRGLIARSRRERWPCKWFVFSRDESKHLALKREYPEVVCLRGDVADSITQLSFAMVGMDIVIHAAANKHVDLSEYNVRETIRTNVTGSENVAQAAVNAGVKRVIGISTDKTCHSISTYGATKLLMERLFIEANRWNPSVTSFVCTRYGNVISSTGSVLTVWQKQLAEAGIIRITDPDMTRFWLNVEQAVNLILIANVAPPGTVTIPRLPAARIGDVREYFLPDAPFEVVGLRAGEKRHEELVAKEEAPYLSHKTSNPYQAGEYYHLLYPSIEGIRAIAWSVGYSGYSSDLTDRVLGKAELQELLNGS